MGQNAESSRERIERIICERLVVEVADHAICVSDAAGRFLFWNRGAAELFGWAAEEIMPDGSLPSDPIRNADDLLFAPDDRKRGIPERERARAANEGHCCADHWYVRRDGSCFFGSGTLTALREEPTGPVRWFARVLRDVTRLRRDRQRLEADLGREQKVADTLQRSQLPILCADAYPGLSIAALYESARPHERVGGDFYDAFTIDGGGVALFVGDASGKGLPAAARAAEVRYTLRAFLEEDPEADPSCAMARINALLCRRAAREVRETCVFTALTLAVVYPERGFARFVTAGGERPVVVRASRSGECVTIEEGVDLALGITPGLTYESVEVPICPNDLILFVTDGITESRHEGMFFGTSGVLEAVRAAYRRNGPDTDEGHVAREVLAQSQAFRESGATDDVCLLAARVTPADRPL